MAISDTDLDALLHKHAERLQEIYDNRTAGDNTFLGALVQFMLDYQEKEK